MTEMTSSEYEQYVTKIVRQFGFCKHAKISNNRRFQGKRQPGEYEIDIAVEVRFSEAIYFLMIIECKYWNRPVDRPVIQALAQTRDALSAHKAVVATVQGFSKEAISVAEAHGIALWRVDPEFDGELLKSVASDNREVFRSLIKYRKTPFSMDWSVFPDFYHLDLR
jgi:restriction endonuclease